MSSLKVAHITETFTPRIGGIETALATFFHHTPDIEHIVYTNPWPGTAPFEQLSSNVVVERVPPNDALFRRIVGIVPAPGLRMKLEGATALGSHLLREWSRRSRIASSRPRADLVHIHSAARVRYYLNLDSRYGLPLGRWAVDWWLNPTAYSVPTIMTDHSLCGGSKRQFEGSRVGEVVRRVPYLVCVEPSGFQNACAYVSEHGLATKTWHIPNPVDTSLFRPRPVADGSQLIVGYVGRSDKPGLEKILELVRAAPDWLRFRVALAGEQIPHRTRMSLRGPNLEIDTNLPNELLPEFYAGIHVLIDPGGFGTPRTVLEALACGRIVIRLREAGSPDEGIPKDVSPFSSTELSSIIRVLEELRRDSSRFRRLAEAGRDLAIRSFDARRVAEQYKLAYASILRGKE